MVETEEVIRRFLDGDEEAFSQIVRSWERKIFNLAWRMLGNREDAQDVAQDTFLSIFRSLKSLRDPGSFSTWLYRITLNHCQLRWRIRASYVSLEEWIPDQNGGKKEVFSGNSAAPPGSDSLEALDIIHKALSGLSEDHRTAVILKEYMGLSLQELADVMGCPLSTAKSRLYHGIREVQRNLARLGVRLQQERPEDRR
jgi:RNA polymerase sigma-70 factor (ECF subfamily)